MAQIIKIKGNKTNANATPSSLVERELASNLVDRCLFGSDGTSVFKYYTGSTKYFDANGYANNANKLGGQTIDYFASADGVADALDEIIDSLKGYQPLITSTNKLAYSLISGVPTSLKNPNALTINNSAGTAQVSYDGSAVKSLTLTKAMVGLGNVENTALSTWVGTNKITTLGTITTGVWNGTKIANGYLANSAITIAGTSVSLGGSITAATLQSNLGFGTFAYKSSLAFADLTNKPTTIGGFGITDAYTKSQVDSALGGYLPLSGGTISGNLGITGYFNVLSHIFFVKNNDYADWVVTDKNWQHEYSIIHSGNYTDYTYSQSTIDTKLGGYLPLSGGTIDGNLSIGKTNNTTYKYIQIHRNNKVLEITNTGDYGVLALSGAAFSFNSNGAYWNSNTLIHSNNYTDYTYSKSTIDTKLSGYLPLSGGTISSATLAPLNVQRSASGAAVIAYSGESGTYGFIGFNDTTTPKWWNTSYQEYTLIHSGNIGSQSVASAAKLTTARTIWGQSFDGTKNISGSIVADNDAALYFKDTNGNLINGVYLESTNKFYVGYGAARAGLNTYYDGNNIYFRTSTTPSVSMVVNSSGNVGIGTTSPTQKLHVDGSIYAKGGSTYGGYALYWGTNNQYRIGSNGDNDFYIFDDNTSSKAKFRIGVAGADRLNILTNGNVLIGTTTDSGYKLDVSGNAYFNSYVAIANNNGLYFKDNSGTIRSQVYIDQYNNTSIGYGAAQTGGNTSIYGTDIVFHSSADRTERVRILSNGNVGIGTTSPQAKLHVNGNAIIVNSSKKGAMASAISSSAIVEIGGIGQGNDALYIGQLDNSTIWLQSAYGGTSSIASSSYTYPLVLNPIGGNVGIGTTSPSQKLHVNGNILIDSGKSLFGSSAAIIASLNGSVELKCGNVNTNSVCLTSAKELRPFSEAADAIDLGSSSYRWKNVYGNNIDLKSSSPNIITLRRNIVGGGAFIDYYYSNLSDSQWRVGANSNSTFTFNKFSGTTEAQGLVTISADGVLFAKKGIWSDGYVSAKGQNTSSDMRLKNVLNNVVLSVKDIANAPSIRFAWKNGDGVDVGSSAQYWQGLLPDAVKERDGMLEMQYANIALLSAIAIAKKVETHEERIARLEKENKELRNEINMMKGCIYE